MKKILILDNNIMREYWGSKDLQKMFSSSDHILEVRRGPQGDLPKNIQSYERLVISGSMNSCLGDEEWVLKLQEWRRGWIQTSKPVLGVCFGHQMLVRFFSGKNANQKNKKGPEYGWSKIKQEKKSKLLHGLSDEFYSFSSHVEEAAEVPSDFVLTSSSELCAIQSIESIQKPWFGIQFHPEKTPEGALQTFKEHREKKCTYELLGEKETQKRYSPDVSKKIMENFVQLS